MDPSAMDFMMHYQQNHPNSATSSLENGTHTHCPALRSAADPQSLLNSPTRGTHHYDPVHGSTTYRHRWRAQQSQRAWQPPARADQASQDPFQMSSAPSLPQAQPNNANQSPFSLLTAPESYHMHSTSPSFHYSPPMPALPRIRSTAPAQHSQGSSGQNQAGPSNLPLHRGHIRGANSGLPGLSPVPTRTSTQSTQTPAMSAENSSPPVQQTDRFNPLHYLRQESVPSTSFSRTESNMQTGPASESRNPQSGLPATQGSGDTLTPPEGRRSTATRTRRQHLPRLPSSASDWSSDDDQDTLDPDSSTYSVIEAVSAGHLTEDRLREQQILRGAVSGRRVASKKAIASLQCVNISDLPENERTCVICYNDFGVANPEGINEAPLRLPKCKHVFGDHCIKKWFLESDSCPYCRDKVPSEPQYRSMTTHNVFRFMRQHHIQIQQLQQAQAARQTQSRERERNDAAAPPGRPTSTMLNSMPTLTSSPFSEFGYGGSGDTSTARRVENSYLYGSRPSAWHAAPERRSPPNEFNDNRRRTRARHGSLRGSPPSGRTNSFSMSPAGNQGNQPQPQNPYHWFSRPATNHHRNSAPFDATAPSFSLSSPMGVSESYLNPLNGSSSNGIHDDYPLTLPQMRSQRPQYMPPLSPTVGGPDIYMANADDVSPNHPASHQPF
ncbi:hypothetical protein F5X99DRAFT_64886 [Biscogniauxia marginata]|nr:hypothetical protein F5X99DRAFT_64886 [Biscogniauxia marginata]